jgi:hypothetical protein
MPWPTLKQNVFLLTPRVKVNVSLDYSELLAQRHGVAPRDVCAFRWSLRNVWLNWFQSILPFMFCNHKMAALYHVAVCRIANKLGHTWCCITPERLSLPLCPWMGVRTFLVPLANYYGRVNASWRKTSHYRTADRAFLLSALERRIWTWVIFTDSSVRTAQETHFFSIIRATHWMIYSKTSVHERLGSWTIRFTNKFSENKASRMAYCVSSYVHASCQHRGKKTKKKKKNPLPNNDISLPRHLPLTPSTLLRTGTVKLN